MTMYYYECHVCGCTVRSENVDDGKDGFERVYNQNCGCAERKREAESAAVDWDD
jgi:hypothetical protein